ncbi:STAS domain-containing protein [Streptomyces sp. cmx-4-9]|uniref:STAS domain-containing protein n=1 Tax=Streptomyces sp. cmx-4-9 TaxID=2790941 RepID=UPI00397EE9C8
MQQDDGARPRPVVIRASGEMDMDRARAFRAEIDAAVAAAPAAVEVVVDLTALTFCDSSGLNALLGARLHAHEAGHVLRLAAPPPQMMHLLEMTGALDLFPVDPLPPGEAPA